MGEELRSLDSDVFRVDQIAQTLGPAHVERWANEHKYFEALDRLRQNLDEIARTDFRKPRTSARGRTSRRLGVK